ncbi:MAG: type I-B CRISPR-associated protein Cas7/Cst2/DevR [Deltaproteobacteria bacterium]|nr:type I-B CRISPR-associated protein Cas7/Cst2/DevR [Deltaproteobacteria bacterium]
MSHVTGIMLVDAPATALNNAGKDEEVRGVDNAVAVKFIRAPDGKYPYVSAQAIRYWVRNTLSHEHGWTPSPVFRETKVAYTDAEPTKFAEDDLFGYMRAASKSTDVKKAAKRAEIAAVSTPIDSDAGEVTRISPFRVGTLVSISPVRITGDFGTMARAEGDPVPHVHQFYKAVLKAPLAMDLAATGTFFISKRVGYKNIDKNRIESARNAGATEAKVYGFDALRLPIEVRKQRVKMLVQAIGRIEGGAKQTLHLTDTAPSVLVLAVCKSGNQPFMRLFTNDGLGSTVFRTDVLEEATKVFKEEILSDIFIGWAKGFLDEERKKLEEVLKSGGGKINEKAVTVSHPREAADAFSTSLSEHAEWFE